MNIQVKRAEQFLVDKKGQFITRFVKKHALSPITVLRLLAVLTENFPP